MGKRILNKKDVLTIVASVLLGFVIMIPVTGVIAVLALQGNSIFQILLPMYIIIFLANGTAWIITRNWIVFAIVTSILYLLSNIILGKGLLRF